MITFKGSNKNERLNGYYCSSIKSAKSAETLNGEYIGEIILPLSALKDEEMKERVKKDMYVKMNDQLFKIVEHDKTLKNIIIYLVHISDELRDTVPVEAGYTSKGGSITATYALDKLKQNTQQLPFELLNYCTNKAAFEVKYSNMLDNIMGQNGFLESFNCEMERDNYRITFRDLIGADRGVKAIYRRNLKGIKVKSSSKDVITKIYPMSRDGIIIDSYFSDRAKTGKIVERFVEFDTEVREAREFTTQDGENVVIPAKTEADVKRELANYGKNWFKLTDADIPSLQIEVDLILLENTEEYKHLRGLERINLGDYVEVMENPTGTNATLRAIKITKDELNNKNVSITLSSMDKEFSYKNDAKAIENALKQANKIIQQEKDLLSQEIEMRFQHSSNLIKTALGGHVYKRDGELLIMDTDDPATATKVWRWNLNGLGYSSNGVDGDYRLAMTMDGAINADFITAGVLTGNVIRAGLIKGQYVEINNSTTFADGYNPADKADKAELETGMKEIRQELSVKDNQLKSEIAGIDANNNEKISRLVQTINGLTLMMTGVEESIVSQSNSGDVIVDETKLKSKIPELINDLINKHDKVIAQDWSNYKWASAEQDKEEFTTIYNYLYSNSNLSGTAKTNLYNAYSSYNTQYKHLSDYYTGVRNGTIEANKLIEDARLNDYRNAIKNLVQRIEEAKDVIEKANKAKLKKEIEDNYAADILENSKLLKRDWSNYKWASAEQDKEEFTTIYNYLYSNPDLLGTAKTNLYNAYSTYNTRYKYLSDYYSGVRNGTVEESKLIEDARLKSYRDSIKTLVQRIEEAKKYVEDYKNSKIVTQYKADISATKKEFNSEYTKITNQISGVDGRVNTLSTDISSIKQRADGIETRVTRAEGNINSANSEISSIKQRANSIELSVSKKVDSNRIISAINLSNEAVRISASKIHLDGYVTVNKLTTEKYVRAPQLNTSGSDRVGVGVTNVNAGRLSSNTAHTSQSGNRLELENQWINFYNGSKQKMRAGFDLINSTLCPTIYLGDHNPYNCGMIYKYNENNVNYAYINRTGTISSFVAGDGNLRLSCPDGTYVDSASLILFPYKANNPYMSTAWSDGTSYSNTLGIRFGNGAGIYLDNYGTVEFCRPGAIAHTFYSSGAKTGGTIEVDGKNLGMSPVDSPQVLLEDLYIDEEVSEEGTKIYLNDTFKKTIAFPYAVFCSNDIKCVEKNRHYFILKGKGTADVKVVGKRIGFEDIYYREMKDVVNPELDELERAKNGKIELDSYEELKVLQNEAENRR